MPLNQMSTIVATTVTAADSFTDVISFTDREGMIDITGTFAGTVSLEYRRKGTTTWNVMQTFTEPALQNICLKANVELRAGVASGNFTSGSIDIALYER